MHIKIIKSKAKRELPRSDVFRTLEYRQVRPGVYMGGSWNAEDEFPRNCRQKWILQAVESHRVGRNVVKTARHICTINFYDVVDALRDISPDQYVESYMEQSYVRMSMERCFGNGDSQEAVQKIRAAVGKIVTQIMTTYNASEEAIVRKENADIRLEVDKKVAAEEQSYNERRRLLQMRELALEEDMRPIRETATVLAERFFRQAVMEHHPDLTKGAVEVEVANEKMVALLAVKKETFRVIRTIRELPPPEDCQDEDIPF
ncbi:MAG: hypothetical protein WAX69_03285 [Victivallales bacterium]